MLQPSKVRAYKQIIEPYCALHTMVYARRDFAEEIQLISMEDIPKWAKSQDHKDLHVSIQRYARNKMPTQKHPYPTHYSDLWMDFDDEETRGVVALQDMQRLAAWMQDRFGTLLPEHVRFWFSGGKGFHACINANSLAMTPSEDFHEKCSFIAAVISREASLKSMDFQLYAKRKTLRLENSRRSRLTLAPSGDFVPQYKIELSPEEVLQMDIEDIRFLAREPRAPRISTPLWMDTDPYAGHIDFMREVSEAYLDMKRSTERISKETRIVVPVHARGKAPSCINSLLEYRFPENGKRNKAMLSLIGFYKDTGASKQETIERLEAWTQGIPWGTHKLRERMGAIKPNVDLAFGHEDASYNFSCGKTLSINKHVSPGEKLIRCDGAACKFVSTEQVSVETSEEAVSLQSVLGRTDGEGLVRFVMDGLAGNPYAVPGAVRARCIVEPTDENTIKDMCRGCAMMYNAENANQTPDQSEPLQRHLRYAPNKPSVLEFVDTEDWKRDGIFRQHFGIPRDCMDVKFTEISRRSLQWINISSHFEATNAFSETQEEGKEKEEHISYRAYMVLKPGESPPECSIPLQGRMAPVADPKTQRLVSFVSRIEKTGDALADFEHNAQLHDMLYNIHAVKHGETLKERIAKRQEAMERITRIVERRDEHLLIDLSYHSPYVLTMHERHERGETHTLLLGDPSQGKTTILARMMQHFSAGVIVDGANIKRTGFLFRYERMTGSGGYSIRWGILPRMHRQLVGIEEFSAMDKDIFESMTLVRSSGVLQTTGALERSTPCRVRTIYIGNPSSVRGRLDHYSYGIDAFRHSITRDQDLRRFDLFGLMRQKEIDIAKATKLKEETHYTSFACSQLVLWAWTRRPEEILWEPSARDFLYEASEKMARRYRCDLSMLDAPDMLGRLGRIAQSVAAMVYSTDEQGKNLHVLREHAEFATETLEAMLTDWGDVRVDTYSKLWQTVNELKEEELEFLESTFSQQPWFPIFAQTFIMRKEITPSRLDSLMTCDEEAKQEMKAMLQNMFLIENPGGKNAFCLTVKFRRWLTSKLNLILH